MTPHEHAAGGVVAPVCRVASPSVGCSASGRQWRPRAVPVDDWSRRFLIFGVRAAGGDQEVVDILRGEPHAFPGSVFFTISTLPDKTTLHLAAYVELATSCALYGFDSRK